MGCPEVRTPPSVYTRGAWETTFQDRKQVKEFFSEGYGEVNTAGSLACRRTDHLIYNTSLVTLGLVSSGTGEPGPRGLVVRMDDRNASSCNRHSQQATGHLLTREYLSFGRVDFVARIAHGVSGPYYTSPNNAFTCLGIYLGPGTSALGYHNEIVFCVSANATQEVRLGYWVGFDGDKTHINVVDTGKDLSQRFSNYSIEWGPTQVKYMLDGQVLWEIKGRAVCGAAQDSGGSRSTVAYLPWQPMSVRIILRPKHILYVAPAHLALTHFAYTPLANWSSAQADATAVPELKATTSTSVPLWLVIVLCVVALGVSMLPLLGGRLVCRRSIAGDVSGAGKHQQPQQTGATSLVVDGAGTIRRRMKGVVVAAPSSPDDDGNGDVEALTSPKAAHWELIGLGMKGDESALRGRRPLPPLGGGGDTKGVSDADHQCVNAL